MYDYEIQNGIATTYTSSSSIVSAYDMAEACELFNLDSSDLTGCETYGLCEGVYITCIGDTEED